MVGVGGGVRGGTERGRGGDRQTQRFTSQGTTASICNQLSSGGGWGNQDCPENSPSTPAKKANEGGHISEKNQASAWPTEENGLGL